MQGLTSAANADELIIDARPAGAPPATLRLPGGLGSDEAVRATIAAMAGIVQSCVSFVLAGRPAPQCGIEIVRHIYDLLDNRFFHFRADAPGEERLADPLRLLDALRLGYVVQGDCDDRAMCAAVKLLVAGIPAAFCVIGRDADGPYEHVFAAADTRTNRVPVEGQQGAYIPDLRGLTPLDMQEGTPLGEWTQPAARVAVFPIP